MNHIDLLWRNHIPAPARRGRPPKFTIEAVIEAAISTADNIGPRFSVRDVADTLKTPVMSLYSYFNNREQLVELMIDQCRLRMETTEPQGNWRTDLVSIANDNLALFVAHPWLVDMESERAILGPGTLGKYERELTVVESLPLDDLTKDATLSLLINFVRSNARSRVAVTNERSEMSAQQWWDLYGEQLQSLKVMSNYPLGARIGSAVGAATGAADQPEASFTFGMNIIVQGIEAAIA